MITLTAEQLIQFLSKFPPQTPVIATWEGVYNAIAIDDETCEKTIVLDAECGLSDYSISRYKDGNGNPILEVT